MAELRASPGCTYPVLRTSICFSSGPSGVRGMLTCLFVGYLVSLEYPLVSLWFPLETVLATEMFLSGPRLILGGAYICVGSDGKSKG